MVSNSAINHTYGYKISQEGIITQEILLTFGMYQKEGNTNQQDTFCLVRKTFSVLFHRIKKNKKIQKASELNDQLIQTVHTYFTNDYANASFNES